MKPLTETHGQASAQPSFPTRSIGLALILSVLLLVGLGWQVWHLYEDLETVTTVNLKLQDLRGRIIHLDEVLTMSARMAAATGDPHWEERYSEHVPQLDAALAGAQASMPEAFVQEATSQTDEANQRLIDMETRAFDLVRQGRLAQAQELLSSEEYQQQKQVYAAGMDKVMEGLVRHGREDLERHRHRVFVAEILILVAALIILFIWVQVLRLISRYAEDLEQLVHVRTRDLEMTNERLQEEIAERQQAERHAEEALSLIHI